jgi:hypothetical protein
MAIGHQIRHYREKLKLTLEQLSDLCGVDVGTISALEVRDSSRSKYFPQISKAFGLTLEQLADESVDYDISVVKNGTANVGSMAYQVNEPVAVYSAPSQDFKAGRSWPFLTVSPDQYWHTLSQAQRDNIEFTVNSYVTGAARDSPSKHPEPATITAAAVKTA